MKHGTGGAHHDLSQRRLEGFGHLASERGTGLYITIKSLRTHGKVSSNIGNACAFLFGEFTGGRKAG